MFEAAADNEPYTLLDLVPAEVPPLDRGDPRREDCRSRSFRGFSKALLSPADPLGDTELWGYNEKATTRFTGPGYFVAHTPEERDVIIDYSRVPTAKPQRWPAILSNSARLGRFIYHGTHDRLRRVSRHVCVGRAIRGEQPMRRVVRVDSPRARPAPVTSLESHQVARLGGEVTRPGREVARLGRADHIVKGVVSAPARTVDSRDAAFTR